MTNAKAIISFCLTLSIASFAGGAASLVGKKAAFNEGIFSSATQADFMVDCTKDASVELCSCVLDKLQQKYTEDEYLKLDADLRNNKDRPKFTAFINNAADECSREIPKAPTTSGVSEKEAKIFIDNYFKIVSKEFYVSNCNTKVSVFLGSKTGQKFCECAYDHMKANKPKFIQMVMDYGIPDDDDTRWGEENIGACAQEKFTPEIEENFIKFLNQNSVPLSYSKCFVKVLKKEYTVKSFLLSAFHNQEDLAMVINNILLRCSME